MQAPETPTTAETTCEDGREEDEREQVARILCEVDDIPTLPMTITEVLRIVDSPDCSAARLSALVLSDPALAARVLRLANSAYYGFPRAI